jgi:hypothetical protein
VCALVFWLAMQPSARAQASDAFGGNARLAGAGVVAFDRRELDDLDPALGDTLHELLSRVHLVIAGMNAEGPRVVATVHIRWDGERALVVAERVQHPTRVRREVERGSSAALFRETLAHVVLNIVEPWASDRGDETPLEQQLSEPTAPLELARAHERERPSRAGMLLMAQAGGQQVASDRFAASLGGGVGVRVETRLRPVVLATAQTLLPRRATSQGVDSELTFVAARLSARLEALHRTRVSLAVAVGGGIDFVAFSTHGEPAGVRGSRSERIQPVGSAGLVLALALSPRVALELNAGVDVDAAPRRWVVQRRQDQVTLLELARVRPFAGLALSFTVAGASGEKARTRP